MCAVGENIFVDTYVGTHIYYTHATPQPGEPGSVIPFPVIFETVDSLEALNNGITTRNSPGRITDYGVYIRTHTQAKKEMKTSPRNFPEEKTNTTQAHKHAHSLLHIYYSLALFGLFGVCILYAQAQTHDTISFFACSPRVDAASN